MQGVSKDSVVTFYDAICLEMVWSGVRSGYHQEFKVQPTICTQTELLGIRGSAWVALDSRIHHHPIIATIGAVASGMARYVSTSIQRLPFSVSGR